VVKERDWTNGRTTENWSTTKMKVQSLAELKERSGIETDLL
jgi:hypothetical protein